MKTQTVLERQADGSYKLTEEPVAELKQESKTAEEILVSLGLTPDKIKALVNTNTASMESPAFLDKVTNFEVMGVPVGAAAMGSALAILIDRVAIAKLDPTNKWGSWANLGTAFVIKKWGGKFLGSKTADAAALILTYEAVADWVTQGLNKVLPNTIVAQQFSGQSAVRQATKVADNYYAAAFGG